MRFAELIVVQGTLMILFLNYSQKYATLYKEAMSIRSGHGLLCEGRPHWMSCSVVSKLVCLAV